MLMNTTLFETIKSFIEQYPRNRIVFYKKNQLDIIPTDVGKLLAQELFNFDNEKRLPMQATVQLDKILNRAVFDHPSFGRTLAIANLGILFEPDLKQDFKRIIDNHSTNNLLLIEWEGEIEDNTIYFLSKEKGIQINMNNLSHIAL